MALSPPEPLLPPEEELTVVGSFVEPPFPLPPVDSLVIALFPPSPVGPALLEPPFPFFDELPAQPAKSRPSPRTATIGKCSHVLRRWDDGERVSVSIRRMRGFLSK